MNRTRAVATGTIIGLMGLFHALTAAQEPFVTLDSLAGKAEVRRAGQDRWGAANVGLKLYNNDMVRVLDSSTARLDWHNGGSVFVHANSQMLVNLHADTVNDVRVKHATVFFGAVFFVLKKALPRALTTRYNTKIYTPTAVLSIRGTSFEVGVDRKSGATDVRVISGTVLVGNILKKESVFLSAGYQTSIAMNADPVVPKALMDERIDSLKVWVPPEVIGVELKKQIAEVKRAKREITDKLAHKLLVLPFANTSSYRGSWDLSAALPKFLAARLRKDHKPLEVSVAKKAGGDPVEAGQDNEARFVLSGEIRGFDILKRAEITAEADQYREYAVARVKLHLQLVDVKEKKMEWESEVTGEVSGNITGNSWPAIAKKKLDPADKGFSSTILARAIDQTLDRSSTQIGRYLDK